MQHAPIKRDEIDDVHFCALREERFQQLHRNIEPLREPCPIRRTMRNEGLTQYCQRAIGGPREGRTPWTAKDLPVPNNLVDRPTTQASLTRPARRPRAPRREVRRVQVDASADGASRSPANVWDRAVPRVLEGTLEGGIPCFTKAEHFLVCEGWHAIEHRRTRLGRCALVCRHTQGKRRGFRLTQHEFQISHLVAYGLALKEIAAKLSMTVAAVRGALGRTLQKLGLKTSTQLPAFWQALDKACTRFELQQGLELFVFQCDIETRDRWVHLTAAERGVLGCVLEGESNYQISEKRGTSVRTVANQLAGILRKFGASSRGELAAKALGRLPDAAPARERPSQTASLQSRTGRFQHQPRESTSELDQK
jgi:DNA-binding CsgD family transcriptional regulator